jgi:hypothetical protein
MTNNNIPNLDHQADHYKKISKSVDILGKEPIEDGQRKKA